MEPIATVTENLFTGKLSGMMPRTKMGAQEIKCLYPTYETLSPTNQKWLEIYLILGGDPKDWGKEIVDEKLRPLVFNSPEFWENKRKQFGFGEIFDDKKFDDVARKHPQHKQSLKIYCSEIERYISGDSRGVGIILMGPVGTLKTTMLWILAKAIVYRYADLRLPHPMIRYVRYYDACNRLTQERFSGYGGPGYSYHLSNVDVLMMDDIAPFGMRPHEQEEIFEVMDRRWTEKKIVFAATNQSEDFLKENLPQVRDRWNTSLVYNFGGASTRTVRDFIKERLGLS